MKARLMLAVAVAGTLAALLTGTGRAQVPDTFMNLQMLDPAIAKSDLVDTMRSWAQGLGVRCNFCHVGPDDLQGMDFVTDDKPEKRTARKMLAMTRVINLELMQDLPVVTDGSPMVVSCYTCHRGEEKPKNVPPRS